MYIILYYILLSLNKRSKSKIAKVTKRKLLLFFKQNPGYITHNLIHIISYIIYEITVGEII